MTLSRADLHSRHDAKGIQMSVCPQCHWTYPDEMLNPVMGTTATPPICGLCALHHINEVHGMRRKRFAGSMAEDFRQRAISWRKKHPERAPRR